MHDDDHRAARKVTPNHVFPKNVLGPNVGLKLWSSKKEIFSGKKCFLLSSLSDVLKIINFSFNAL